MLAVAAKDGRVAAVVSQCPFTDRLASLRQLDLRNVARGTALGVRDAIGARLGRKPLYVPAAGAPGAFAVMNSPGRQAARVQAPILFCLCDRDAITPADVAAGYAAKAPRAEVKRYPVGHFDIYTGEPFELAVADQTDFLVRHLHPSPRPVAVGVTAGA